MNGVSLLQAVKMAVLLLFSHVFQCQVFMVHLMILVLAHLPIILVFLLVMELLLHLQI